MIKKFSTLNELNDSYSANVKELTNIWCPLLNNHCRLDCVCMRTPQQMMNTITLIEGGCINKMFFGSDYNEEHLS